MADPVKPAETMEQRIYKFLRQHHYNGLCVAAVEAFGLQVRQETASRCDELAEKVARDIGGKFWATHRLNTGLLELRRAIRAEFGEKERKS